MTQRSVVLSCVVLFSGLCGAVRPARAQAGHDLATEERVVQYLQKNVKPGEPLIVSDLYNNVFKTPEERKVLDRLFNTFFKIPLFIAQFKASTDQVPTLVDISRQFNLPVQGEASVLLSIIDNDPRVPKFITRDSKTGEITAVNVEAIKKDRRFGQLLERTLTGWAGKPAPPFLLRRLDGKPLSSEDLRGKNYLIYFWFSGCPPCARISPNLVELQRKFGDRNFTVLAVNADRFLELETTDEQRAAYIKKERYNFPVVFLTKKMQEDYGNVNVYPTLFLVDSKGVIRKYYLSYQSAATLGQDVMALLNSERE